MNCDDHHVSVVQKFFKIYFLLNLNIIFTSLTLIFEFRVCYLQESLVQQTNRQEVETTDKRKDLQELAKVPNMAEVMDKEQGQQLHQLHLLQAEETTRRAEALRVDHQIQETLLLAES